MQYSGIVSSLLSLLVALGFVVSFQSEGLGQPCQTTTDWRDIYILPTNPQSDRNIKVMLSADKMRVAPGDVVTLSFQANQDCYLTLMDIGSSGRIIRLWPNSYSGSDNSVRANEARSFPGPQDGFRYKVGGPDGVERIVAYATSERGKILSEEEFQQFQSTGFKQYVGGTKDLAMQFQKSADALAANVNWGTAQVNLCVGSGGVPSGPAIETAPNSQKTYVLVMAGEYSDIKLPTVDARNFIGLIKRKMGIPDSQIRTLIGPSLTYPALSAEMQRLASQSQPDDTVIVYYSGHGSRIPDRPPLDEEDGMDEVLVLSHKGRLGLRDLTRLNLLVVDDDINVMMKKIPARKKFLIADCCHSGTIQRVGTADVDEDVMDRYYPIVDDTGQEVGAVKSKAVPTNYGNDHETLLSACLDNETASESKSVGGGVFTTYFIKAAEAGAPDLGTAFERAKASTLDWARKNKKKQNPQLTDPHGLANQIKFSR